MHAVSSSLEPLEEFMEGYRESVERNDIAALTRTYNFPLTLHDGVRTVVLADAEEAQRAFLLMRRHYEDIGMARLETRFLASHRVSPDFVLVDVVWRLRDSEAFTICDQRSTYALRDDAGGSKIVAVFLHEDFVPQYGNA